jgi:hypothetical protein
LARVSFQDLDAKLRMTAAVLGSANRKEFVGRFRTANPDTLCDLERMHKWLQGRALPRDSSVLDDWAKVVGSARGGTWLASCTLAAFAAEIGPLFGRAPAELLALEPFAGRGARTGAPASAAAPRVSGVRFLCGAYASYTPAWSPYARGKFIRGALTITPGRGSSLSATYSETLLGKSVRLTGVLHVAQNTLQMDLTEPGGELPLFFSLFQPRPPASVLCGVLSGVTLVGPEPQPSAGRIVMIRVPESDAVEASNRYFDLAPGVIAADLATLGIDHTEPARVDHLIRDFLLGSGGLIQVAAADQAALAAELDPVHIAGR